MPKATLQVLQALAAVAATQVTRQQHQEPQPQKQPNIGMLANPVAVGAAKAAREPAAVIYRVVAKPRTTIEAHVIPVDNRLHAWTKLLGKWAM